MKKLLVFIAPFIFCGSAFCSFIMPSNVTLSTTSYVQKTGDTMTGTLTVPNLNVTYGVVSGTITTSGNVGIGTPTPNAILDVVLGSGNQYTHIGGYTKKTSGSANLILGQNSVFSGGDDANCIVLNVTHAATTGSSSSGLIFQMRNNADSGAWSGVLISVKKNAGDDSSYTYFETKPSGGAAAERLRIDKNGNVGIGTTAPAYKFDVNGSANIGTTLTFAQSATQTLYSTNTISVPSSYVVVVSSGGAVTLSSNPQIDASATGTIINVHGTSGTDTVTLSDGNGLDLTSGTACTLAANSVIGLQYNGSVWVELYRSVK